MASNKAKQKPKPKPKPKTPKDTATTPTPKPVEEKPSDKPKDTEVPKEEKPSDVPKDSTNTTPGDSLDDLFEGLTTSPAPAPNQMQDSLYQSLLEQLMKQQNPTMPLSTDTTNTLPIRPPEYYQRQKKILNVLRGYK